MSQGNGAFVVVWRIHLDMLFLIQSSGLHYLLKGHQLYCEHLLLSQASKQIHLIANQELNSCLSEGGWR